MKTRVIASTKVGYTLPTDEAILLSGKEAGICYLPDDIDTLLNEDIEKTKKRADRTILSGHHSVFDHPKYNFVFEEIPKILAIMLNNEKVYATSEKSARYTHMTPSEDEKELYEKWIEIYKDEISKVCPEMPRKTEKQKESFILKRAQENARYLISVFTPATTMGHTLDLRQLNYILHWCQDYQNEPDTEFNKKLKPILKEFEQQLKEFEISELNTNAKARTFSLFSKREHYEEWGESYSTNYLASFAELAQAQRHRTINYEIKLLDKPQYFIPPIIKNTKLECEWIKDISSLEKNFPQGMLVEVNERGTVENFVLKCKERLCGEAQLEIAIQTENTMQEYLKNTKESKPEIYRYLLPYSHGARCTFQDFKCPSQCIWTGAKGIDRLF